MLSYNCLWLWQQALAFTTRSIEQRACAGIYVVLISVTKVKALNRKESVNDIHSLKSAKSWGGWKKYKCDLHTKSRCFNDQMYFVAKAVKPKYCVTRRFSLPDNPSHHQQ